MFMACLSSKDKEEGHQIPFVSAAGKKGLTLTADLGWTGTGKVKAEGLQSCSVDPLLKTV